jgi:hypothetical protein
MVKMQRRERVMHDPMGFMDALAKRFSSMIIAFRITVMKQKLWFQLRAMKSSLNLHYEIIKRTD